MFTELDELDVPGKKKVLQIILTVADDLVKRLHL